MRPTRSKGRRPGFNRNGHGLLKPKSVWLDKVSSSFHRMRILHILHVCNQALRRSKDFSSASGLINETREESSLAEGTKRSFTSNDEKISADTNESGNIFENYLAATALPNVVQ
ncbi:hypothetical protein ANTPLA_LOCUS7999 [Anthophora plagiata]